MSDIWDVKGGRGKCDQCGEWHDNVAYHRAYLCEFKHRGEWLTVPHEEKMRIICGDKDEN